MNNVRYLFSFLCHQLPTRSPCFDGGCFPLCYRCAGFYLGAFASFIALGVIFRGHATRSMLCHRVLFISSILVFIVDGVANRLGVWWTSDVWRFVLGFSLAAILSVFLEGATARPQAATHTAESELGVLLTLSTVLVPVMVGTFAILSYPVSTLAITVLEFAAVAGVALLAVRSITAARSLWMPSA